MTRASVLHMLPHAGAGAQTYIDVLASLENFTFEVLELSAIRSPIGAVASIAARQPHVARAARRADLVHVHGEVASLVALPWLASRPSVVTLHGLHLLRRLRPGTPQRLGRAGVRMIVTAADRTICVSTAERDELQYLPEPLRDKLVVVQNGLPAPTPIDPHRRNRARASLGLSANEVAVLYVGQLELRKDPQTLVRAVRRVREKDDRIVLLVAGEGPCGAELRTLAGGGVRLLGQRSDVSELLAAADIFAMPSLREGLSFAVLEALGHGVASVVSDAAGNPEAVGDTGLVFHAGDDRQLAALVEGLASDPDRRAALGAAGRARVATTLSAERMQRGTRAVYESVLKRSAPRAGRGAFMTASATLLPPRLASPSPPLDQGM